MSHGGDGAIARDYDRIQIETSDLERQERLAHQLIQPTGPRLIHGT